jgi:hypothetical protein
MMIVLPLPQRPGGKHPHMQTSRLHCSARRMKCTPRCSPPQPQREVVRWPPSMPPCLNMRSLGMHTLPGWRSTMPRMGLRMAPRWRQPSTLQRWLRGYLPTTAAIMATTVSSSPPCFTTFVCAVHSTMGGNTPMLWQCIIAGTKKHFKGHTYPQQPKKVYPLAWGVVAHPIDALARSARPHVGR